MKGVAFPLVWCLLDKPGNSNSFERMKLFNQFLERFGEREVACLTADREFVGKDWFGYLLSRPVTPFRIRIRENYKLNDGRQSLKVAVVFAPLTTWTNQNSAPSTMLMGILAVHCCLAIR